MKKIAVFVLFFCGLTVVAQTQEKALQQATEYIKSKKYETAFMVLDSIDPKNDVPEVVLLKQDIVLNYFVTSIMHQMFALTDIKKDEDISEYRGKNGSYSMHMFQADSLLTRLVKKYPNQCKLYRGLGNYYYDAHLRYGNNWIKNKDELNELMQHNFKKAAEGGCADYLSYFVLGYTHILQEKYAAGIPYFKHSIELNKNYPTSHYNLAYAYLFLDDRKNALGYAKSALDLYEDQSFKSDAARMVGRIYIELNDTKNALSYYEKALSIDPENYYNLLPLLELYVGSDSPKSDMTREAFFNLAPDNPTIYNDLQGVYARNDKIKDLSAFYESKLTVFEDAKVLGSLHFYLGRNYMDSDKKTARNHLTQAKAIFKVIYADDHAVFKAIEEGMKQSEE